ncbi:MAG: glycosyltransferase [Prevotellaceae bacterium]|jgi:glycosyltransferase involved in cell wall biosynthesis|nr:glycosyltransferase [Prevotellaceae bacterium]
MKTKKRIIIISQCMRIGGAERSLITLLNSINYTLYDVDLFLFIHDGEFMPLIPKQVNLLPEIRKYTSLLIPVKSNIRYGFFDVLAGKTYAFIKAKLFCKRHRIGAQNMVYFNYQQRYTVFALPIINPETIYDLAISFLTPHYVIPRKVRCRKSIAWIHTDYSFFDFDKKAETNMWNRYDYIASISEAVTMSFTRTFPSLVNKIILIENMLSSDFIRRQADIEKVDREIPKEKGGTAICSIGRFSNAKNFDNIPFICKKLFEMGCRVKWYLIGYGGEESLIRSKIEESCMQEYVIILGKKENPYPYIKACDIYVQPSRYEGKAVTVREAQILCKPVVITNYATSGSQLENGVDGIIVPMGNEGCAKGIKTLIENKDLQSRLIENCKNRDFGNEKEIEKIYSII